MNAAAALRRAGGSATHVIGRAAGQLAAWAAALACPPHGRAPLVLRRMRVAAVPAIVIVVAAMLLADPGLVQARAELPRWVVMAFAALTDFGKSGWVLWPVGLLLVAMAATVTPALGRITYLVALGAVVRLGFVFTAVAVPGLSVTIVKRLIGRSRPLRVPDTSPFDYAPFIWRADYASFPSGHATSAFATAVAVGALFPRARWALWTFAAVIALSRPIVGAHYPSDVIAGALVGGAGALLVKAWFARRGLGFRVGSDGRIWALPGPSWRRVKRVARRLAGT